MEFIQTHSQYFAVLCGLIVGFPFIWIRRERIGIERPIVVLGICLAYSVFSVFSALVFAAFEKLITGHSLMIGAISVLGVYLICPILLICFAKLSKVSLNGLFDCFAIYACISLVFMRINCLISGCCTGLMIPGLQTRYPVREIEILFYVLMIAWFLYKERKGYVEGMFFPFLMMAYGTLRFVLEWLRTADTTSAFHLSHVWAIIAALIGISLYFEIISRSKHSKSKHRRIRGGKAHV